MKRPLVIAHRGASGERPEHTRAAYERAIEQGCDFIEPDLVMSKDGRLVVRHDITLNETTDVPQRPEFKDRWKLIPVNGVPTSGWFAEDFTLEELKSLRARERMPSLRHGSDRHSGREPILTFEEVIDIARAGTARTGRVIGVYPELKHPSHHRANGHDPESALVAVLERERWTGSDAPVFVQCFEVGTLERLARAIRTPLIQLIGITPPPADRPDLDFGVMTAPRGLDEIAGYAAGIGVDKTLLIPRGLDGRLEAPTPLAADAHGAGLVVHAWTFRAENFFLPAEFQRGPDERVLGDMSAEVAAYIAAGVDGVFTDHPGKLAS